MKERFITSSIMVAIILLGLTFSWMFILIILALTVGGLFEFFNLIKKKGFPIYSYTGLFVGTLIPLFTFFQFEPTKKWELAFIVIALLSVFLMQFMRKDNKNAIIGISTTLFGVIYVSWLFSFLIKIRMLMPGFDGIRLLGFFLLVAKSGDIGALLVGKKIGKRPLMPHISPNKTIEGGLGGLITSSLVALLCLGLIPAQFDFTIVQVLGFGLIIGGVGQVGDLSESLIKRDCNVKDSGTVLPALGGVLDAIDSLLFAGPVFYFYISLLM